MNDDKTRDPLEYMTCCKCETVYAMSQHLYEAANHNTGITFYCPYGHSQHFTKLRAEVGGGAPPEKKKAKLIPINGGKKDD